MFILSCILPETAALMTRLNCDLHPTFLFSSHFSALFLNLFLLFLHLISLFFFLIVSSTSFALLPTPICGIYFVGAVRIYFFALTLQYFLFTFFTTPQFYWVFYSSLALCRNSPRPKCNAQIEDYSHCPVITYSYSHG